MKSVGTRGGRQFLVSGRWGEGWTARVRQDDPDVPPVVVTGFLEVGPRGSEGEREPPGVTSSCVTYESRGSGRTGEKRGTILVVSSL